MKEWKKFVVTKGGGLVQIPKSLMFFVGLKLNHEYEYKIEPQGKQRFLIRLRKKAKK